MLPEGWKRARLAEICSAQISYGIVQTGAHIHNGIPCLRVVDIAKKEININECIRTTEDINFRYKRTILGEGDIVLALRGEIGKSKIIEKPHSGINITRGLAKISADQKVAFPLFLFHCLNSPSLSSELDRRSCGSALQEISLRELRKTLIPLPSLPEQKKIAAILSTWDRAIEGTERLLTNSQQQKKALMQQLLTAKKRLPGFVGEWESFPLGELEKKGYIELKRGKVISQKDIADFPGENPIYSSSTKRDGMMGKYAKYMFDEELISWSVDGGGDFFYRSKHKFSITNVSGYMRLDNSKINYKFLSSQLQYLHKNFYFDYQTKAHPSVIRDLYVVSIPPLPEQKAIAAVLTTADDEITVLKADLERLRQEKKALMQQLLTGKRRVMVDAEAAA